jgi:hypothetical protein
MWNWLLLSAAVARGCCIMTWLLRVVCCIHLPNVILHQSGSKSGSRVRYKRPASSNSYFLVASLAFTLLRSTSVTR